MAPQPTASTPTAAKPAAAASKPTEVTPDVDVLTVPKGDNPMAERQIQKALDLEYERGVLLKKINANRELLRLMDDTDELSDAQGVWLDTFYASKEVGTKRSDADIEASRKMREAARKRKIDK